MHGPRVAITLVRFLPDGLVSIIRDGPGEAVVHALERTTETPELMWTPAMAASLSAQIATMASDIYREQQKGSVIEWDVPEQPSGQQEMRDEPQVNFYLFKRMYDLSSSERVTLTESIVLDELYLCRLVESMSGYS